MHFILNGQIGFHIFGWIFLKELQILDKKDIKKIIKEI